MKMDNALVKHDVASVEGAQNDTISMIERLATDSSVDVSKLEKLLEMQERVMARQEEMAFNVAMNAAQSGMGRISTDALNPQTKSRYASYAKLDRALRPIYTANGFAISFNTLPCKDDYIKVEAIVTHTYGHTRHYTVDMPADGKGAKGGDVMTKTHANGAAMSYGMRYLLKMIFNVAIGEEDTDGNEVDVNELIEAIEDIKATESLEALKGTFAAMWNAFPNKKARASLTKAKDDRKKELENGN
jgi:hypothetical protein